MRRIQFIMTVALIFLITGCGTNSNTSTNTSTSGNISVNNTSLKSTGGQTVSSNKTDADGNPLFQNKTTSKVVSLDRNYDPVVVNSHNFSHVQVVDAKGNHVTLDAKDQSILLQAYWCPHCQRTLVLLNQNVSQLKQLPVIVNLGFQSGTTLAEAKKLIDSEKSFLHLSSKFRVYYGLNVDTKELVPKGFPAIVYNNNGTLDMLYGEHTLAVWKKALAVAK